MTFEEKLKLFSMSHILIESDLNKVEENFRVNLGRNVEKEIDEDYYPQFSQSLRDEASLMANYYEIFYCLERSIRKLIEDTLSVHGDDWWNKCVPEPIKNNVQSNLSREIDFGYTQRSERNIDYTTFGELGEIVRKNWSDFDAMFSSEKAFTKIMTSLNVLRGPIAHCSLLAPDEILRLQLTLKDWFRLME